MQNPVSPPKFKRTCPTCYRQVEPGYKFCETCGTRIPELSTCSKCGTQFIAPVKFCDLCGAPVIPGRVPEPDDSPQHSEEEYTGSAEDQTSKRDKEDIQEPDTDELLERYGKEYGDDETLESFHKPKSLSSIKHEVKKPVTVPGQRERGSETVDDALFLSPWKREAPAKPLINTIRIIGGCVLIAIIAAVYFIGLPMLTESGSSSIPNNSPEADMEPTFVGTKPASLTETTAPAFRALVPLPTQQLPSSQKIYFQVWKNPITSRISVIFTGSSGEGSIKSADIRVTHPGGSVATGIILPLKGVTEISLDGSKETDRVEIIAQMASGETYRVYDELVPL